MRLIHDASWRRRGFALLWGAEQLIADPKIVVSVRQLFALSSAWPDELPAFDGKALIVAGLDACLDALSPNDASRWIEEDLRPRVLSFQSKYESQCALVFWLPGAQKRLQMSHASQAYSWVCAAPNTGVTIEIGRCLWGGAESDVARIIWSEEAKPDTDGVAWVGLHHPRIS